MEETNKIQMRKRNMKLFPAYKAFSWDYLFFYTVNFLFLTQIKNINAADVVLIDSFYYLFTMFSQIPATFIIEFLGRKNSIILGNILNCTYILVVLFSNNLFNLIIAEMLSATAFAIKESAEPSLLNESIPPSKWKSKIFAKISQKGASRYYIINAITKIVAGILYEVNPYIPLLLSLFVLILVTTMSILFIEPVKKRKKKKVKSVGQLKEIGKAFQFVLKSERVKSLILFAAVMKGILSIVSNYEISMLEDLEVPSSYLGILFAILGVIAGMASKRQEKMHNRLRNKTLSVVGFSIVFTCIFSGIFGVITKEYQIGILFIMIAYIVKYAFEGMYEPLMEKYMSNFTNEEIDTKIFTANNFLKGIAGAVSGILAAFLLDRMETAYCMVIIGILFGILMLLVCKFMKSRVGLKPEEYAKEEVKYDKMKETL
ncbi:MAG: MFS transporter [Clostridia bacterium]|nr:MFS transporter [Clostridia bacterium]